MNQSTVSYEELEDRLAICCEFLMDPKKPMVEAYASLMNKIGRKIVEYSEFEYWFKRFQNNQFDLGYGTSQDSKITEIQNTMNSGAKEVKDVSTMTIETDAFNESDVPEIFQTLVVNEKMTGLGTISLYLNDSFSLLKLDDLHVRFEKKTDNWTVTYEEIKTTIKAVDREKSIIDHLWFVLKNPNVNLKSFGFSICKDSGAENHQKMDSEKLDTLLQSMFNSIDHQIQTNCLIYLDFNEDTFFSMLKHVKPLTLKMICFDISWKEERNYQKLKQIVKTNQWKQARRVFSLGVTPLRIEDLFQYEKFWLELDSITSEIVLTVTEHFFNSTENNKCCYLSSKNQKFDINAIIDFLLFQIDGSEITKLERSHSKIVKSEKTVILKHSENRITIHRL